MITQLMKPMKTFPSQFQKVVDYLKEEHDVEVTLGQMTSFLGHNQKKIVIHHNYNLQKNGLIALLHEAGHVLQEPNGSANFYKSIDDEDEPRKFTMYQFLNEINAWDNGVKLMKELELEVDSNSFMKLREEALLTYFPNPQITVLKEYHESMLSQLS